MLEVKTQEKRRGQEHREQDQEEEDSWNWVTEEQMLRRTLGCGGGS